MTDRRGSGHMMQSGSPAYREIKQSIADQADRTEAVFDRIERRLDRMDMDARRTDMKVDSGNERMATELQEIRRDIGELRDATSIAANKAVTVADAAATKATAAAEPKLWQKWQAWATAFVAIVIFYRTIGPIARDVEKLWEFIKGPDPIAAKQDPTK